VSLIYYFTVVAILAQRTGTALSVASHHCKAMVTSRFTVDDLVTVQRLKNRTEYNEFQGQVVKVEEDKGKCWVKLMNMNVLLHVKHCNLEVFVHHERILHGISSGPWLQGEPQPGKQPEPRVHEPWAELTQQGTPSLSLAGTPQSVTQPQAHEPERTRQGTPSSHQGDPAAIHRQGPQSQLQVYEPQPQAQVINWRKPMVWRSDSIRAAFEAQWMGRVAEMDPAWLARAHGNVYLYLILKLQALIRRGNRIGEVAWEMAGCRVRDLRCGCVWGHGGHEQELPLPAGDQSGEWWPLIYAAQTPRILAGCSTVACYCPGLAWADARPWRAHATRVYEIQTPGVVIEEIEDEEETIGGWWFV
jgi:hypothetical protein